MGGGDMEGDLMFILMPLWKLLFIITAPVTFIVGIFLIYDIDIYLRIEKFFAKSYFLSKKLFFPRLDKNREALQLFLLRRRRAMGVICIINSLMTVVFVAFWLKVF